MQSGIRRAGRSQVKESFVGQVENCEFVQKSDHKQRSDMTPIFKANLFCTKGMYYLVKLKYTFRTKSFLLLHGSQIVKGAPLKGSCSCQMRGILDQRGSHAHGEDVGLYPGALVQSTSVGAGGRQISKGVSVSCWPSGPIGSLISIDLPHCLLPPGQPHSIWYKPWHCSGMSYSGWYVSGPGTLLPNSAPSTVPGTRRAHSKHLWNK